MEGPKLWYYRIVLVYACVWVCVCVCVCVWGGVYFNGSYNGENPKIQKFEYYYLRKLAFYT